MEPQLNEPERKVITGVGKCRDGRNKQYTISPSGYIGRVWYDMIWYEGLY